ncbi:hypothetical protein [Tenacibaculum sp. nBUS_03]|uniref:hypothetical protein n=1 Tax=Tenacibaculum sp. nBUS_03 TaxID=3395320 RepID=UPI003EBB3BA4
MKKSILNLGKALKRAEQKEISGGVGSTCFSHADCPRDMGCCDNGPYVGLCMLGSDYRNHCN